MTERAKNSTPLRNGRRADSAPAARPTAALRVTKTVASLLCATIVSACASTSRHHLALTNYADRTLMPENRAAGWALTPVLIPLTVATLTLDNLIVAPLVQLPSAGVEARAFYNLEVEGYYSHAALTPFQIALTPVIFAGSWVGRSIFGVDPDPDALWGWPEWGRQWRRDEAGRLIGPPEDEAFPGSEVQEPESESTPEPAPAQKPKYERPSEPNDANSADGTADRINTQTAEEATP